MMLSTTHYDYTCHDERFLLAGKIDIIRFCERRWPRHFRTCGEYYIAAEHAAVFLTYFG